MAPVSSPSSPYWLCSSQAALPPRSPVLLLAPSSLRSLPATVAVAVPLRPPLAGSTTAAPPNPCTLPILTLPLYLAPSLSSLAHRPCPTAALPGPAAQLPGPLPTLDCRSAPRPPLHPAFAPGPFFLANHYPATKAPPGHHRCATH
ncbi:uncharacterized protein LOC131030149 [Cryptomeria japonica]|uniref:uncharacterized protein LOC131030149 n=1 Tax=Cryptomeria japonica TaxID=3369 RepID=UPI0027DA5739|nr:uncharacterized protein LOC131030149 [Cryptomeria japonica]